MYKFILMVEICIEIFLKQLLPSIGHCLQPYKVSPAPIY